MIDAPLRVEFAGSQGDQLAARLDLPAQPARAFALFAHCFTCSKDVLAAARISRALTESGIAVLRFDFTGLGQSGGEFANSNFSSNIDDLIRAADYLREHYRAPSILIGHSLGGAAVLAAASRIPETKAVVTIAAPADPKHILQLIATDQRSKNSVPQRSTLVADRSPSNVSSFETWKHTRRMNGSRTSVLRFWFSIRQPIRRSLSIMLGTYSTPHGTPSRSSLSMELTTF